LTNIRYNAIFFGMKKTSFAVRRYRDKNRPNLKWQATGPLIAGKRWRRFFSNKSEADVFLEVKRTEHENFGARGIAMPENLRVMAQEGAEALAPYGKSIRDAVEFYLPHVRAQTRSVSVSELVAELLSAKAQDGKSVRYLEDLRSRLGQFVREFGEHVVASFTTKQIDDWLRSLDIAGLTRNHFRRALHTAFEFALRAGYNSTNPVAGTAKAKVVPAEIGVLTVSECERLLTAAASSLVDTLPYVVLGLYCGLRSAELERLSWSDVDLEEREVVISGRKAKSAQSRVVPIAENAIEWLMLCPSRAGAICPPNLREQMLALRARAKIEQWPHNALRHSFASYSIAAFSNAPKTAYELGHTDPRILFEHYRRLVRKDAAMKFWSIRPSSRAIIEFVA
jgi:integrase